MKKTSALVFLFCFFLLSANFVAAQAVVRTYDFNSLSTGTIHGQDNWFYYGNFSTTGYNPPTPCPCPPTAGTELPATVFTSTTSGAYKGSNALQETGVQGTQHGFVSRINNASWSTPALVGVDYIVLELNSGNGNFWGNMLQLGYDKNADGDFNDPAVACQAGRDTNEIGFGLSQERGNIYVYDATGAIADSTPRIYTSGGCSDGWVRYRLIINPQANGGQGLGYVYYRNLTTSGLWQTMTDLQGVNMKLNGSSPNQDNPGNLNALVFQQEAGGVGTLDSISVITLINNILPATVQVCEGNDVTINTLAVPGATAYQWTTPDNTVITTTTPTLTITNAPTSYSGVFNLAVVSDVVTSIVWTFTLQVNPPYSFTENQAICPEDAYTWQGTTYTMPGTYTASYTSNQGCDSIYILNLSLYPSPTATASGNSDVCEGSTLNLTASGGSVYSWSGPDGFTSTSPTPAITAATIAATGTYVVTVTNSQGCTASANTAVSVHPTPVISVSATAESCTGAIDGTATVTPSDSVSDYTYLWSNTLTTTSLSGLAPGLYTVTATDNNGCQKTAQVEVPSATESCASPAIYLPNIFSPNGDNINDVLYVRGRDIKTLSLVIYDRWGEKVFETSELANGWDGTFRNKPMEPAVFVYKLKAEYTNGETVSRQGNITLVR